MLFSENNQEAYDNMLMAHRIAEHKDVLLPLMVCQDGFITSHSIENIQLESDEEVKKFRPTLEVDQAEDAIYHNDLKDISDIMQEMLRVAKETEK